MKRIVFIGLFQFINFTLQSDDFLQNYYNNLGFSAKLEENLPPADLVEGWENDSSHADIPEVVLPPKKIQRKWPASKKSQNKIKKLETIDVKSELGYNNKPNISKRKRIPKFKKSRKNNTLSNPLIQVRNTDGSLINKLSWLDNFSSVNQNFPNGSEWRILHTPESWILVN